MTPGPPSPVLGADPQSHRLALGAAGLLREFNLAGVLDAADVHTAQRLAALAGEPDPRAALALALTVRAVRGGSTCLDLTTVADQVVPAVEGDGSEAGSEVADARSLLEALPWPEPAEWLEVVARSPLLGPPAVLHVHEGRLLYLDRYWREETQVCEDLLARPVLDESEERGRAALEQSLDRVFPQAGFVEQRAAAEIALSQRTTVLTGGPGTGKTTTVAALLALLAEQAETPPGGSPPGRTRRLRVALAAPTGKAAARLQQAVQSQGARLAPVDRERLEALRLQAVTLHRLLGSLPQTTTRFRHHRDNRLPHDVVVVDETSMVSLTMMARLLEATRPEARLILVGDADQLTSVEAGAVLADLVEGLGGRRDLRIAALRTSHRFGEAIGRFAEAVRTGDADRVVDLLGGGDPRLEWVADDPAPRLQALLVPHALRLRAAALGDPREALDLLDRQRLLCAHRNGPHGVHRWNRQVERWLSEATGEGIWSPWYPGRPFLVTANDYGLGLHNGDTGVAVSTPDGGLRGVVGSDGPDGAGRQLATSRLGQVETMHAMTIHKSQGSQADDVLVLLPPPESRLLTRELLYTAVTRARQRVVVVGSEADVRAAVGRRAQRATGLRQRLGGYR